jgi:hypothetical protein
VLTKTDLKYKSLIYLRPREFPFELFPLPAEDARPFALPEVFELRSLLTAFLEEELLLPFSLRGEPEDFGLEL